MDKTKAQQMADTWVETPKGIVRRKANEIIEDLESISADFDELAERAEEAKHADAVQLAKDLGATVRSSVEKLKRCLQD